MTETPQLLSAEIFLWSSFLIKDSQVRGWRANTGASAQISMGGMNYSIPAPIIYFTSGREGGREAVGQEKNGDAKQTLSWHLSLFLFPLG